ncbi:MAG TPA: hypothetical protein VGR81_06880 [Candidatus Acidoferrales bacterium]|nr:hypothetical protein [Candidatus Acidoferrales bacterium]
MLWFDLGGAAQMLNCLAHLTQFIEHAAQIEVTDGVPWVECKSVQESSSSVFQLSKLIENAAEIYMWLTPFRLHLNHLAVKMHCLMQPITPGLATHRPLKQFIRGS